MRKLICVVIASATMGGCVQQRFQNDLVNVPPDQIKEATLKAETRAGISTAEFKELGDTKRAAVVQRLIERTWGKPAGMGGSSPRVIRRVGTVIGASVAGRVASFLMTTWFLCPSVRQGMLAFSSVIAPTRVK